jgi:hypothetical protein
MRGDRKKEQETEKKTETEREREREYAILLLLWGKSSTSVRDTCKNNRKVNSAIF